MVAVRQKPAAALAWKKNGRAVVPQLPPPPPTAPTPPAGLSEYALDAWEGFWRSDVSGAVNMDRDGERLRHWIQCVEERRKLWEMWQEERVVMGSTGTTITSPIWRQIKDISAEIERAEAVFGMTPLYKMRLTGALDSAERAEVAIVARREKRKPVRA